MSEEKLVKLNKEDKNKSELFDKTQDVFKEIFTDNGLNKTKLIDFISNCVKLCNEEERSSLADDICFEAVNQGSFNFYEAIGIFETSKNRFIETWNKVMLEEAEQQVEYCNCKFPEIYHCEQCGNDHCKKCGGIIKDE